MSPSHMQIGVSPFVPEKIFTRPPRFIQACGPAIPCEYSQRLQREFEERVRNLADLDPLTGLFNRTRFEEELTRQVARHRRTGESGALLLLDLDRFKAINHRLGRAGGDDVLRGLGASLMERSRSTDVVARLTGDQFAVLLPAVDSEAAEFVAAELVGLVRRHRTGGESDWTSITASVGVALFNGLDEAELLALADAGLQTALDEGGDRFVVLDPAAALPQGSRRASEANRLRRALDEDRLVLHAQPIWDLTTDHAATYECSSGCAARSTGR